MLTVSRDRLNTFNTWRQATSAYVDSLYMVD